MTLSRVRVIFQFILVLFAASFSFGLLGGLFFGLKGASVGVVLANLILIWAAFSSERVMVRSLCAYDPSPGILNSYSASIQGLLNDRESRLIEVPRLLIYVDPLPNALSVRRMAGKGVILLSTGLLAQMGEAELRTVLQANLFCIRQVRWAFYSFCACLLVWLLKFAPRSWVDLFFSRGVPGRHGRQSARFRESAWLTGYFLLLFPWIRFLLKMGDPGRFDRNLGVKWDSASRQIRSSVHFLGHPECPGASMLFVDHWTKVAADPMVFSHSI